MNRLNGGTERHPDRGGGHDLLTIPSMVIPLFWIQPSNGNLPPLGCVPENNQLSHPQAEFSLQTHKLGSNSHSFVSCRPESVYLKLLNSSYFDRTSEIQVQAFGGDLHWEHSMSPSLISFFLTSVCYTDFQSRSRHLPVHPVSISTSLEIMSKIRRKLKISPFFAHLECAFHPAHKVARGKLGSEVLKRRLKRLGHSFCIF